MNALLLVDIQNDFCPGGALAVPEGDTVVEVANRLMARFDLVMATQDWHPADHGSFAANHPGRAPFQLGELAGQPQVLWPTHCVQHTRGAAFHPRLRLDRVAAVFAKGTDPAIDSYSGFFDNARMKATGLHQALQDRGVDTITILGLATDYCVRATALDGRSLGYDVVLVEDGCRGVEMTVGDCARALQELRAAGVTICRSPVLL